MENEIKRQLEIIKRGTVEIIQEKELAEKIKKSLEKKKPLIIKAGFDPTAPDIHLGHTVLLRKMRHFQELGHKVVFLIGDFTGMIGDPSGRSEIRKILTKEEVLKNAQTYKRQVAKILDVDKIEVKFNDDWLGKLTAYQIAELTAKESIARVLERDDFFNRYKRGQEITFLEFLYPLFQAYDSVVLKADVELGGTDQKFNLLMGRELQKRYGQEEQVVITMPLLRGTDGVQKMSKSLGNYIGINESPKDIFGKIMSISDDLMWDYYEFLTDKDYKKIKEDVTQNRLHPKQAKVNLAKEIVSFYYGSTEAEKAEKEFEQVFKNKQAPETMPIFETDKEKMNILELLKKTNLVSSTSAAARLVQQGAVTLDGVKVTDLKAKVEIKDQSLLKAGKRKFIKIFKKMCNTKMIMS